MKVFFFIYLFSFNLFAEIPVNQFLLDPEKKISSQFKVSEFYYSSSLFWFEIYSKYDDKTVIIHDRHIPNLVYGIIDFSSLNKNELNSQSLLNGIVGEKLNLIKNSLLEISRDSKINSVIKEKIILSLKLASINIPTNSQKKSAFFKSLATSVRLQSGQRSNILKGLITYLKYETFFTTLSKHYDLPLEVLALPFVESSFNFNTTSKVGANGLWQIMPSIENKLINSLPEIDGTASPILSTFGALHLIKSNFRLLDSWDLTITAYNSGSKHLMIAKELFSGSPPLTLEKVLKFYKHPHLGFAAKNFYSEFLAMAHVLAYKDFLFPELKNLSLKKSFQIGVYINKCSVEKEKIFKLDQGNIFNAHLSKLSIIPPGNVIFSISNLDKKKYISLSLEDTRIRLPINWKKIYSYICNTKDVPTEQTAETAL